MSGKAKRRRSASLKQLTEEGASKPTSVPVVTEETVTPSSSNAVESSTCPVDNVSDLSEKLSSDLPADLTSLATISEDNDDTDVEVGGFHENTTDSVAARRRMSEKKTNIKVKSSRRASFQLSNTVNNLAKESGVEHLIGIVNQDGDKKTGMRDQINDLKDEIERRGLTKYIDTVNGYSMSGEIKMLRKVLSENININMSASSAATSPASTRDTATHSHTTTNPLGSRTAGPATVPAGSENMVKALSELRAAHATIVELEDRIEALAEEGRTDDKEEELCELEEQLLKANQMRLDNIALNTELKERVAVLETEVKDVTTEASETIRQLEDMLDELTVKETKSAADRKEEMMRDSKEKRDTIARLEGVVQEKSDEVSVLRSRLDASAFSLEASSSRAEETLLREKDAERRVSVMEEENGLLREKIEKLSLLHEQTSGDKAQTVDVAARLQAEVAEHAVAAEGARVEAEAQASALRREITLLQTRNSSLVESVSSLEVEVETMSHTVETLRGAAAASDLKLEAMTVRCDTLQKEVVSAKESGAERATESSSLLEPLQRKIKQLEDSLERMAVLEREGAAAAKLVTELRLQLTGQSDWLDQRKEQAALAVISEEKGDEDAAVAGCAGSDEEHSSDFKAKSQDSQKETEELQRTIDGLVKDCADLEAELDWTLENGRNLQDIVDEQNEFLRDAARKMDESDEKMSSVSQQLCAANEELVLLRDTSTAVQRELLQKEADVVKLLSDNEFYQRRNEDMQRKIVNFSMQASAERINSTSVREIERLRVLLAEMEAKNSALFSATEREKAEKMSLKKMLQVAYAEQERVVKTKIGADKEKTADLWGAMNKNPSFVGFDIIFKLDKLVIPTAHRGGSVVKEMAVLAAPPATPGVDPVDEISSLFQPGQRLDSRMVRTLDRLMEGWSVRKIYSNHKPKEKILRVDVAEKRLYCIAPNPKSRGGRSSRGQLTKGVLLSVIDRVVKEVNSPTAEKCFLVCVELVTGENMKFHFPSEEERDDLCDGLLFLLSTHSPDFKKSLCEHTTLEEFRGSLLLQSLMTHSVREGEDHFEAVSSSSRSSKHTGHVSRTISERFTPSTPLSPRVLPRSSSEHKERERDRDRDRDRDSHERNWHSGSGSGSGSVSPLFPVSPQGQSYSHTPPSSPLRKAPSLFSMLHRGEKEQHNVEINEIGALFGSERREDRRHSVNLSEDRGRRKSQYSFVSENPFSQQQLCRSDNTPVSLSPLRLRDTSSAESEGSTGVRQFEGDEGPSASSGGAAGDHERGVNEVDAEERAAQARLLSLSKEDDLNDISSSGTSEPVDRAHCLAREREKRHGFAASQARMQSTGAGMPTATGSGSVGAENAKRFGLQQVQQKQHLLHRSSSGVRDRSSVSTSTDPSSLSQRSTLMNVDAESLEALRQKAQRRSSASREMAAQTQLLREKLSTQRDAMHTSV